MARPRQVDRDTILAAGLDIADHQGLDGLTMRAVATRLGVTPMALYRHVHDKEDLLAGIVERILDELPVPDADEPWDAQLATMGRGLRATARRHPAVFPLLLQVPASTERARGSRERVYVALRAAGVPEDEVARTERLVSTMILGFAASEATGRFRGHSRATIDADYDRLEQVVKASIDAVVAEGG